MSGCFPAARARPPHVDGGRESRRVRRRLVRLRPPLEPPARSAARGTGHVHIGSIATTLQPGEAEVTAALRRARTTRDDLVRPERAAVDHGRADTVRARVEELVALADVVKCSEDDISWLYPGRGGVRGHGRWAGLGAALTVVTLGGAAWRGGRPPARRRPTRPDPSTSSTLSVPGTPFMAGLVSGCWTTGCSVGPAPGRGFAPPAWPRSPLRSAVPSRRAGSPCVAPAPTHPPGTRSRRKGRARRRRQAPESSDALPSPRGALIASST